MGFIVPVLLGYVFLFSWNSNVDGASLEAVSRLALVQPEAAQNRTSVQNSINHNETNTISGSTLNSTTLNLLQKKNNATLTNNGLNNNGTSRVEATTKDASTSDTGIHNASSTIGKNNITTVVANRVVKNVTSSTKLEDNRKKDRKNEENLPINISSSATSKESLLVQSRRNVTNEENLVDTNSRRPISKNGFDRTDNTRSIDIKKYISPEFHNKNNVFKLPLSEETQRFLSFESDHPNKDSESYESTEASMTTTSSGSFDDFHNDFRDHPNDSDSESSNIRSTDHSLDDFFERPPVNSTKRKIEITKVKNVHSNDTEDENGIYSRKISIEKTSMNYHMTFNDTEILDDEDHDSKEEKDFPNSIKSSESDEKQDTGEENGSKEIESETVNVNVTRKPSIPYDLPPKQAVLNKNESRTTVLTNSIMESKLKNIKKDPFIPTYSPSNVEELNKEHIDQYPLTDSNKPIIIEKRGRIIFNPNNSTTKNSSAKIDKISENVISHSGSTTILPLPNTKKNPEMNQTETIHFKKDLVVEPVTNNYINSDLDSIKTTTAKIDITNTVPVNTTVENNRVDIKTQNLITIMTVNTTSTVSPLNHTTTKADNHTTEEDYDTTTTTTTMFSTTTLEPDVTTTETLEPTTILNSSSEEFTTAILDDGIFSYTTVDNDTPSTTDTSEYTTIGPIIIKSTTTAATSSPTVDTRNSTTHFDTAELMASYTTQISVSTSFSVSSGKRVNVTLSKETLEDLDGNKDEIESKEVIDDDDDDMYDAPTTEKDQTKYENNTEEQAVKHNSTSTLPTTIEILHVASVGPHQTTFTPETFQPDHSYQTPQLTESNDRGLVGAFTEIEEPSEATTIAGSHEMGSNMDGNGATIAAIVISCIGAVCLLLLAGLLIIIKRRHKRFNYGQRCTPVSLDAYSVDNVSVYNSVRRKGIMRASKRSYGNPAFDDSCSTSNPLNFTALTKFSGNREGINSEFDEIPQIFAQMNELPEGCDTKNRYANVIPLPETRVVLTPMDGYPNSDYINANFVMGPKSTKGYYIACQAPLQDTVDDFWRMVWEQNSRLILMLTNLYENHVEKCADYLPPSEVLDCHRLFGDFEVTLKKREVKEKYVISSLQLKNMVSNSWREVTHMWYLGWPEKGVPMEFNSIIAFLIEARSYLKLPNTSETPKINDGVNGNGPNGNGPVVVHCSPGTGRTGTVIAIDMAIREFEQARQVDIPKLVYRLRRDRAGAVQTKDQYAFIYKVVSTYAIKLTGGVTLESI